MHPREGAAPIPPAAGGLLRQAEGARRAMRGEGGIHPDSERVQGLLHMCGIVGVLNTRARRFLPEEILVDMLAVLQHRGPDESGIYTDPHIGIGHVRLSIIGVDNGVQPMANEDDSLWIVYNGEAFNYIELKAELLAKGHRFETETDTEVVLHLYEEYGAQCLNKINGQFAFAVWNRATKELFLARDRVGIHPLYYTNAGGKFLFASEIKALFVDTDVKREIDPAGLRQVFSLWTTVDPQTAFRGIYELPAGRYMTIRGDLLQEKRYWELPYYGEAERWKGSLEEATEELHGLLKDAVRIRLRADVPVGSYLSGGLDSSLVTAFIAKYFDNGLQAFAMTFKEAQYDESAYQQDMVRFLHINQAEVMIGNSDIHDYLPIVIWHCEKPLLRTAPIPLYLLSDLVRKRGFKVVLTGEGSDEMFAGYNIFKEAKIRQFWGRSPDSRLRPLLLERLYPYVFADPARHRAFLQKFFVVPPDWRTDPFFSHRIRWNSSARNRMFFSKAVAGALEPCGPAADICLPEKFDERSVLSKAQFLEAQIFLSNYLLSCQGDRVAMAHSIEVRPPFLDYRIIDFCCRLPDKWKINGLNEKYILKRLSIGIIPKRISERPKKPYRAPIKGVFWGKGANSYTKDLLSDAYLKKTGYFDPPKVGRLIAKLQDGGNVMSNEFQNMAFIGILSTQLLHRQFIEGFSESYSNDRFKPDRIMRA